MPLTQLLLLTTLFDTVTTLTLGAYGTSNWLAALPVCCYAHRYSWTWIV